MAPNPDSNGDELGTKERSVFGFPFTKELAEMSYCAGVLTFESSLHHFLIRSSKTRDQHIECSHPPSFIHCIFPTLFFVIIHPLIVIMTTTTTYLLTGDIGGTNSRMSLVRRRGHELQRQQTAGRAQVPQPRGAARQGAERSQRLRQVRYHSVPGVLLE